MPSWKRGDQHQRQRSDLPGRDTEADPSEHLKGCSCLDLTGCTVDEILYYVSNGYPVFAMTGSNDAVLVVGYDANNVVLYDPAMGQTYKRTIADADEMFLMQEIYSLLIKSKKNT